MLASSGRLTPSLEVEGPYVEGALPASEGKSSGKELDVDSGQ